MNQQISEENRMKTTIAVSIVVGFLFVMTVAICCVYIRLLKRKRARANLIMRFENGEDIFPQPSKNVGNKKVMQLSDSEKDITIIEPAQQRINDARAKALSKNTTNAVSPGPANGALTRTATFDASNTILPVSPIIG